MPLTIEQQRALAIAQAKRKRAEAEAAPSLRSETDAIIEEAAAAIPGGYEAFAAKPADPQRMAAMGYVQDPLAKSGYARPQAQQPRMADTGNQNSLIADVARGLEAPVRGLTGGGLEGWARTTQADPVRGASEAVNFISPVDEAGRAYLGLRDAGAGLIEGDMGKAAQGAQQASIEGSFAALQMLPGSMTLRGMAGPRNALAPTTLAGAERAAVQATRAPPVGKPVAQAAAPQPQSAPFSAPAEPKASGFLRNNADRIVGGSVGATAGTVGDAWGAEGDGSGGGPDIINPGTGAIAGMIAPRLAGRGFRAAVKPFRPKGFDQRVVSNVLKNALAPLGKTAEEVKASLTAQYGDKPVSLADATQQAQNLGVGLSRLPGNAPELAMQQADDVFRTRTGRLFSDVETTTRINPASVANDLDEAIQQASEEISPAYEALFEKHAGVNSERLMELADDPVVGQYVRSAIKKAESLKTTAGQAPSNARIWDLVKQGLDYTIQSQKRAGGQASYEIRKALEAVKAELDALMPEYKAVRDNADAPRMREAREKGKEVAGGNMLVERVRALASGLKGKPLTALQMGAIEKLALDIEKGRGIDGIASERMREILGAVFDKDVADNLVARIRADQVIIKNAQRRNPNVGSATSQAAMGGAGGIQNAAEMAQTALAFKTNPLATMLAAMSRSGSYTKAQRDLMADILYGGATDENLARIYGNRPPRNPLNVEPPPTPQGPPVNRLGMRGNPEAIGAAGGTAIGMATAPDQNGDGVVDAQERMMGGAGGALTGGIAGRGVRALGGRATAAPARRFRAPDQSTFGGVNAKTADKVALARAQNMEAEGAGRDAIWDETGWFKGVDGKWRFEIDDSGATLTGAKKGPLGAVIDHPELYNAYPDLSNVQTQIGGRGGAYIPSSKYNDEMIRAGAEDPRSIMLHEAGGHGVQNREGFARGGNPENVLSKDLDAINQRMSAIVRENDALKQKRLSSNTPWVEDAAIAKNERLYEDLMDQRSNDFSPQNEYKAYKRLAGEAEARNVQTRRDFTPEERRARRPWETQDVPDDQQIVRFGSGKAESRPKGPPRNKLTPNR